MQPTLTQQELETARFLKSQGKSTSEIMGYISGIRTNSPSRVSVQRGEYTFGTPQEPSTFERVAMDAPRDIVAGFKGAGEDLVQRGRNIREGFQAGARGEQTPIETGAQMAGNVLGGAFDVAFRGVQTAASLPLTQETQTAIGEGIGTAIEKTGIVDWYESLSPRTQRNLTGVLGLAESATVGGGGLLTRPFARATKGADRVSDVAPRLAQVAEEATQGNVAPAIRVTNATLDPTERTRAVNNLAEAYRSSLVENRMSINNKLEDLAKSSSRGGETLTRDDLLRNLADEGYIPDIEARLAKFDSTFRDIEARQRDLMNDLDPLLTQSRATIRTDDLFDAIRRDIIENPHTVSGLGRSTAELSRFIDDVRIKYGDELNAQQVNAIRKDANASTKAFRDSDKFTADTYSAVGNLTRNWLDDAVPNDLVRRTNAEWARLNTLEETARILNNQQVDVGLLGRALGSYVTVVAGTTAGVAVGGPGGLVVAGLLAKITGDKLADMMRKRMFDDRTMKAIRETMRKDDKLREELLRTMNEQDRQMFQMALPPAPEGAPRSSIGSGRPMVVTPEGRAVAPRQVAEFTREGAVRQPTQSGIFKKQAERFKSPEAFVKAVRENPAWLAKLEAAGVTPEEIAKLTFAGTAALALPLLLDEDISPLGFLVVGSIVGGQGARKAFAKKIAKKVNEADLVEMTAFSGAYKEGAYKTVDGTMQVKATKNFTQKEAQQALDDALRRAEDFPVISDASLGELAKTFDEVAEFAKLD
jgi:hypothetical protein